MHSDDGILSEMAEIWEEMAGYNGFNGSRALQQSEQMPSSSYGRLPHLVEKSALAYMAFLRDTHEAWQSSQSICVFAMSVAR